MQVETTGGHVDKAGWKCPGRSPMAADGRSILYIAEKTSALQQHLRNPLSNDDQLRSILPFSYVHIRVSFRRSTWPHPPCFCALSVEVVNHDQVDHE